MKAARTLAFVQGIYFVALGIWSLLSIRSFQTIRGAKTDNYPTGLDAGYWLVLTVAALIAVLGADLLLASRRVKQRMVMKRVRSGELIFVARGSSRSGSCYCRIRGYMTQGGR
jgi:hypothetical protein